MNTDNLKLSEQLELLADWWETYTQERGNPEWSNESWNMEGYDHIYGIAQEEMNNSKSLGENVFIILLEAEFQKDVEREQQHPWQDTVAVNDWAR